MIPWNPVHRYSGMTSHFDSLDGLVQGEVPAASADEATAHPVQPSSARAPLGFVDVRADANGNGAGERPGGDDPAAAPHVELSAIRDAEQHMDWASAEEKVPFYKREISLGRKRRDIDSAPTVETDEQTPVLEVVESQADSTDRIPFYKREISFRRADTPSAAAPAPAREPAPAAEPEPVAQPEPVAEPAAAVVAAPTMYAVDPNSASVEDEPAFEPEPEPSTDAAPVAVPAAAAIVAEAPEAVPAPAPEPAGPEVVFEPAPPRQRRELGFGKRNGGPAAEKRKRGGNGRRAGRRLVGLKIGASQLAAAVVQEHDGQHELLELARMPLDPGIVLDGEVRDADALVSALRSFFAEQKLPTRDVRIGISSNRIGVRTLEIGGIEDETRFDNAVRFKAHEVLPIAVTDSVLDYRVLEERQAEGGAPVRRVLLVVAPRDQVSPYVEVAQRAGLKLDGIDLESLALLRAFVEPRPYRTGDTSTVVVAIGHEASTLLVSGGGVCEFTRVFDWGGSTLQEAIAQELQVHPTEAATILRHLSLSGNSRRIEGVDEDAKNRALDAVKLRLTPFARELVSSLQFYQTQPDSLGIGEIVITGGTSQLDGLAEALHQMIGVRVRVGDPLQRLTLRRGVESGFEQSLGSLAVPIGLAIDDDRTRSVDLTPRDVGKESRRTNLLPIVLPVAAVVPLAAMGFLFAQAHGKTSSRESKLSSLQTQLATMPQPKGPTIDPTLQSAEAARASAVAQVLGGRTSWDGMLQDLSRVLPANVWLTSLKASVASPLSTTLAATAGVTPTPTPSTNASSTPLPPTPTGVTISGYTYSQSDVAVLLARLVALPSFQNVQLQSSSVSTVAKKDVVQFTILADLAGGAA